MTNSELWGRLEDTLRKHAPLDYADLQPPASAAQIAAAEAAMGVTFPASLREAYLRHNGVPMLVDRPWRGGLFYGGTSWCELDRMVMYWQMKSEVARDLEEEDHDHGLFPSCAEWWGELAINPGWWNPKWIPIGLSNSLSTYFIDLDPCPRGTFGQIIEDGGMQDGILIAPGLNEWIGFVIESFESGRFVVDPKTGEWLDTVWGFHARKSHSYYGWRSSGAVGEGPPA